VFYVERAGSIEIWRVLHGKRDIRRWLQDGTANPAGRNLETMDAP
jgi:hypothetical protein